MVKISVVYFMWNPEICQDPPTCGLDDLVLSAMVGPKSKVLDKNQNTALTKLLYFVNTMI